jgi:general secretion pathway protein G
MKGNRGFTLIEVIVVAAIIAILAGILVPMIFNQIDEARKTRALAECKSISSAVLTFRKDTAKWPFYMPGDCTQTYTTIQGGDAGGSAAAPADNPTGAWGIGQNDIALGLILNLPGIQPPVSQSCYNDKAGSYLTQAEPDPWNHQYIINAANFAGINPVWAISAGPNGCLDTSVNSQTLNDAQSSCGPADDIGIRIK